MRKVEVEVKYHHMGTQFKVGKFAPCSAGFFDDTFCFTVSSKAEREAAIAACEYIAESLKGGDVS